MTEGTSDLPTDTPTTLVGQWLRASALDRRELRDRVRAEINRTGGFDDGRGEVVFRTLAAAASVWWRSDARLDERQLKQDFVLHYKNQAGFTQSEVETAIDISRGKAPTSSMKSNRRFLVCYLLFVFACHEMEASERLINFLIVTGERDADASGAMIRSPTEIDESDR